jgi:hypothetical protein
MTKENGYTHHISEVVGSIDEEMKPSLSARPVDCENRKDIFPRKMKYHVLK